MIVDLEKIPVQPETETIEIEIAEVRPKMTRITHRVQVHHLLCRLAKDRGVPVGLVPEVVLEALRGVV